MSGDPESLRRHYEGARHKDRVAKKKEGTPCWAICCGNCCASCACGDCSCSCGDGSGAEGDCVNPFAVLCGDCSACGDLLSCCGECTSCLCENALAKARPEISGAGRRVDVRGVKEGQVARPAASTSEGRAGRLIRTAAGLRAANGAVRRALTPAETPSTRSARRCRFQTGY